MNKLVTLCVYYLRCLVILDVWAVFIKIFWRWAIRVYGKKDIWNHESVSLSFAKIMWVINHCYEQSSLVVFISFSFENPATLTERLQTSSGATGNQVTRSVEFTLGENSSSGATDHPATSYFLRPSPSATGFQASGSLQKINGQSPSGVVLTLLSPVNVDRETASSQKVTKSSNHAGFQTDANFSAFVQRSSPTSDVLDLSAGSSASLQTASLPSRARGVQTTGESIGTGKITLSQFLKDLNNSISFH